MVASMHLILGLAALAAGERVPWGSPGRDVKTGAEVSVRARVQIEGHLGDPSPAIAAGLPIVLRYEVRNEGSRPVSLWHAGFWPNHRITVRDAAGRDVPLLAAGKTRAAAFSPRGARDKNVEWPLRPGQVDGSEGGQALTDLFELSRAGTYVVEVLYEEGITFTSNRLAFTVLPEGPVSLDFTARVTSVSRPVTPGALLVAPDPRFLLLVHVLSVSGPDGPFAAGTDQAFAIHSPARLFAGDVPVGQVQTFHLAGTPTRQGMSWSLTPRR